MKKPFLVFLSMLFIILGITAFSNAAIIDFAGGTATLWDGTTVVTDDNTRYDDVDFYVEDGIMIDFIGGTGIIGNYYQDYTGVGTNNAVIHAHPFYDIDIVFSMEDGSVFDLNYVDMTSNTENGGYASTGNEESYITASNGHSLLLDPNDWGIEVLIDLTPSDGIGRIWLDANFDAITSFTLSSLNAYCFGMDNFFINEEAPSVPEPATLFLLGTGLLGLAGLGRRKFFKK